MFYITINILEEKKGIFLPKVNKNVHIEEVRVSNHKNKEQYYNDKLCKKYGITFVATKGQREESVLGSYTDTYAIAKVHGESCQCFI